MREYLVKSMGKTKDALREEERDNGSIRCGEVRRVIGERLIERDVDLFYCSEDTGVNNREPSTSVRREYLHRCCQGCWAAQ